MNYDFIIYGGGISSEIAALALAKYKFSVCYVKNQTTQKTESNLVTFLSSGSVNYLYSIICLLYTSPSPRDGLLSRMPSSA